MSPGATSASPLGPGAIPASYGRGRACDSPVRGRLLLRFVPDLRDPDFSDNRPAPACSSSRFPPIRRICGGFIRRLTSSVSAPTMWTSGGSRSRTAPRLNAESPGERTLLAPVLSRCAQAEVPSARKTNTPPRLQGCLRRCGGSMGFPAAPRRRRAPPAFAAAAPTGTIGRAARGWLKQQPAGQRPPRQGVVLGTRFTAGAPLPSGGRTRSAGRGPPRGRGPSACTESLVLSPLHPAPCTELRVLSPLYSPTGRRW
jgi:hypothetical protein